MELEHDDAADGVRLIRLKGRLDLEGAEAVDLKLTSLCAVRKCNVILDIAGVEFLSSIGVSVIVRVARALTSLQGCDRYPKFFSFTGLGPRQAPFRFCALGLVAGACTGPRARRCSDGPPFIRAA